MFLCFLHTYRPRVWRNTRHIFYHPALVPALFSLFWDWISLNSPGWPCNPRETLNFLSSSLGLPNIWSYRPVPHILCLLFLLCLLFASHCLSFWCSDKGHERKQLGGERIYFPLQFSSHTLPLREDRAGTPRRNWSRCHLKKKKKKLTGLLGLLSYTTHWSRGAIQPRRWALPHQSLSKKMHYTLTYRQILWR